MATSDNVVRAGLTPKLRDTEVLCKSLTYTQASLRCSRSTLHGKMEAGSTWCVTGTSNVTYNLSFSAQAHCHHGHSTQSHMDHHICSFVWCNVRLVICTLFL